MIFMKRFFFFFFVLFLFNYCFAQDTKKEISVEDIWKNRVFSQESVAGVRSMNDGKHYTTLEKNNGKSYIIKYSYKTGNVVDTIIKSDWLKPEGSDVELSINDYQFSYDESKILIASEREMIYRHSTRETNYIWDRKERRLMLLTKNPKQRYATFSPNGSMVAFVRNNNIFIKNVSNDFQIR